VAVRVRLGDPEHPDRVAEPQCRCALLRHDDERTAPVGDQAAVAEAERVADPRRREHVGDRELLRAPTRAVKPCAQRRAATATAASCSGVVPNSCMCRAAASA
jgi:hypothetical protein